MVEIIHKLLIHNPEERLSAEELLRSSIMHPPLLDDIQNFFQLLDHLSTYAYREDCEYAYHAYKKLLHHCINQKTPKEDIMTWLNEGRCISQLNRELSISLQEIFVQHCHEVGAQYLQPATLSPKMSTDQDGIGLWGDFKQLVSFLDNNSSRLFVDQDGTVVALPNDSYTPFARHIASYNIKAEVKRFCISHVYHKDPWKERIGLPPKPDTELAFDIASPALAESSELRKADAEVVQVIQKVLKRCRLPSVLIKLSHQSLLEAVFTFCKIAKEQRSNICHHLIRAKSTDLKGNEIGGQLKFLSSLLMLAHHNLNDVKCKLTSLPNWAGSEAASMADKAFDELEKIINNLTRRKNSYPVYIDLSVGLENYDTLSRFDGFLFRFIDQEYEYPYSTNILRYQGMVLAAGGRYDALVASLRNAMASSWKYRLLDLLSPEGGISGKQHAVGGSIYVENILEAERHRESKKLSLAMPLLWLASKTGPSSQSTTISTQSLVETEDSLNEKGLDVIEKQELFDDDEVMVIEDELDQPCCLSCGKKKGNDESNKLVRCDECESWFHSSCVNVVDEQLDNNEQWVCPLCTQKKLQVVKCPN